MRLIEQFFPYTADIEATVDICKKMGLSDYDIRQLLVEGKTTLYWGRIIDPANGEEHPILNARLTFGKTKDGALNVLVENKAPAAFFADLNEKEKSLKSAATKSGLAGEIYRENLKLKERLKYAEENAEIWKSTADVISKKNEKADVLLAEARKRPMYENADGSLAVSDDIVFMTIFNLYKENSGDHKDGMSGDGFYKYEEILKEFYSGQKVLLYRIDELEERLGIPVKTHLVKNSEKLFGDKFTSWDALVKKNSSGEGKRFLKIEGSDLLEVLRALI